MDMKNSRNFFQTYSGHEKIMDKFWINKTGHIPDMKIFRTNSVLEQILDKFRTNSRQIPNVKNDHILEHFPDNKQCPEFVYYYSEHFPDIFRTFCFYRASYYLINVKLVDIISPITIIFLINI